MTFTRLAFVTDDLFARRDVTGAKFSHGYQT